MKTIIDPSTLTDEQRKCIRKNYNFQSRNHLMAKGANYDIMRYASEMAMVTMEWLFGKEFFEEIGEQVCSPSSTSRCFGTDNGE